jgi:hypothetical protein
MMDLGNTMSFVSAVEAVGFKSCVLFTLMVESFVCVHSSGAFATRFTVSKPYDASDLPDTRLDLFVGAMLVGSVAVDPMERSEKLDTVSALIAECIALVIERDMTQKTLSAILDDAEGNVGRLVNTVLKRIDRNDPGPELAALAKHVRNLRQMMQNTYIVGEPQRCKVKDLFSDFNIAKIACDTDLDSVCIDKLVFQRSVLVPVLQSSAEPPKFAKVSFFNTFIIVCLSFPVPIRENVGLMTAKRVCENRRGFLRHDDMACEFAFPFHIVSSDTDPREIRRTLTPVEKA